MKTHIEPGIDSMNYTGPLTAAQKNAVLSELKKRAGFQKNCGDYFKEYYHYSSDCFADQGVKIQIEKTAKTPWRISLIVHPTLVLGGEGSLQALAADKEELPCYGKRPCQQTEKGSAGSAAGNAVAIEGGRYGRP